MQIDYQRWPSGAFTKNSINTKMRISQEPLVETDPTLCQNVSCMKPFCFFAIWHSKMAPFAVTKNSTERENGSISVTVQWMLTKFVSK